MPRVSELYRTAFVTGASTGLGLAFTEMLLADGVRVGGPSRDVARLAPLASKYPALFTPVALELRNGAAAEQAFIAANASGQFELVINNAGYGVFGQFAATEFEHWREQLEVMLVNTARLAHVALGQMLARNH